ncbi:telomeric repeat-binding factor 1 isoform X2 [Anguilla anguilla]|uniref:telomeric repeat-binding factor 1 isoform X2 n=1 Tax=Anguilla anguilla TaxID=7936 RepID=UPI0015AF6036|nr:telomeric repeat-binding factor 1 isoform X2 [Anguilla anguilla]
MLLLKTNMERYSSVDSKALIPNVMHNSVNFSDIQAVVDGWMIDFFFISACRFFKEDTAEEFNKSMRSLEVIVQGRENLKLVQVKKVQLCGFLSRVINGKRLDVQFENDKQITPLMSALSIWKSFSDSVADKALYGTIQSMLFIQSAGVCLEQGYYDRALAVLERMVEDYQMPEELKMKLCAIVKRKDTYHQCLVQFSFARLVESVKYFLEFVLQVHPSDFLLKTASKVVWACQGAEVEEYTEDKNALRLAAQCGEDSGNGEGRTETSVNTADEDQNHGASESSAVARRQPFGHKRRLLPKHASPWRPEPGRKLYGGIKRRPRSSDDLTSRFFNLRNKDRNVLESTENEGSRRKKVKWTYEEDRNLKAGVSRHGEGSWSKILLEFDFSDRTGVMLKDRWRTLKKQGEVGS